MFPSNCAPLFNIADGGITILCKKSPEKADGSITLPLSTNPLG